MSQNMSQNRNTKIDFLKGILMLGVVYGHFINAFRVGSEVTSYIHTIIRTCDMPFFMFLGGYLLFFSITKNSHREVFINKIGKLAFPTILWGGVD